MRDLDPTDAECALLGTLLLDSTAWTHVAGKVRMDHLAVAVHRVIFGAIGELASKGQSHDVMSVAEILRRAGKLESVGGLAFLSALARNAPTSALASAYADSVLDHAKLRMLTDAGSAIARLAVDDGGVCSADELISQAIDRLVRLQEDSRTGGGLISAADLMRELIVDLDARREAPQGVSVGLPDFDALTAGLEPGDLTLIAGRPGMGKAQPLDEPVLTPSGWKLMGELAIGDFVTGPDGAPRRILGIYPQGPQPVWSVNFADGRRVRCTKDHLWTVHNSKWTNSTRTLTTEELPHHLKLIRNHLRIKTPPYQGERDGIAVVGLDPYLLGFWLGDGDPAGRITAQTVGLNLLRAAGAEWGATSYDQRRADVACVSVGGLVVALRALGIYGKRAHEKEIPQQYMHAPRAQRLALLQGLLDTDGWVEKFGAVRFCSSSLRLAQQVRQLIWSVGGEASLATKKTTRRDAYVVTIRMSSPKDLFRHQSKLDRCQESRDHIAPRIASAEETSEVAPCQCIKVDHEDGLYVTRDYIVTHNTAVMVTLALNVARERPVAVFSAEMPSMQLMRRAVSYEGGIPQDKLRRAEQLTETDWQTISEVARRMQESKLWIDESSNPRVSYVRAECYKLRAKHGALGLVMVDYLQLMGGDGNKRHEQLRDIAYGMKALAKDLRVPVIALAQLSRSVEQREDKRPVMSDLYESSGIEQAADNIAMLYRRGYYDKTCPMPRALECSFVKVRNGQEGVCYWDFQGEYSRVTPMNDDMRAQYLGSIAAAATASAAKKAGDRWGTA